jgi:hypothetical protein
MPPKKPSKKKSTIVKGIWQENERKRRKHLARSVVGTMAAVGASVAPYVGAIAGIAGASTMLNIDLHDRMETMSGNRAGPRVSLEQKYPFDNSRDLPLLGPVESKARQAPVQIESKTRQAPVQIESKTRQAPRIVPVEPTSNSAPVNIPASELKQSAVNALFDTQQRRAKGQPTSNSAPVNIPASELKQSAVNALFDTQQRRAKGQPTSSTVSLAPPSVDTQQRRAIGQPTSSTVSLAPPSVETKSKPKSKRANIVDDVVKASIAGAVIADLHPAIPTDKKTSKFNTVPIQGATGQKQGPKEPVPEKVLTQGPESGMLRPRLTLGGVEFLEQLETPEQGLQENILFDYYENNKVLRPNQEPDNKLYVGNIVDDAIRFMNADINDSLDTKQDDLFFNESRLPADYRTSQIGQTTNREVFLGTTAINLGDVSVRSMVSQEVDLLPQVPDAPRGLRPRKMEFFDAFITPDVGVSYKYNPYSHGSSETTQNEAQMDRQVLYAQNQEVDVM